MRTKKTAKPINQISCSHEQVLFNLHQRDFTVKKLIRILKPKVDEFDAICASGYSSALIAPIIADKLKKNIVLVRKPSESRHSRYAVEGISNQRCLFLDDLISSGKTISHVHKKLKDIDCSIAGIVLYNDSWDADTYKIVELKGKKETEIPIWKAFTYWD